VLLSEYLDAVDADLTNLGQLGGADVTATVGRLMVAVRPALRTRLLAALDALVQEFNARNGDRLCLTLSGEQVSLAPLEPAASTQPPSTNDLTARIALRVSDQMKREFEQRARGGGVSVNSWIVRALDQALRGEPGSPTRPNRRVMRGSGRA
jgi:hypothetical protein